MMRCGEAKDDATPSVDVSIRRRHATGPQIVSWLSLGNARMIHFVTKKDPGAKRKHNGRSFL